MHCCRYVEGASEKLRAVDREDLIPNEVTEPRFLAKAKLSRWLQTNTERSDAPSEMEILDSQLLGLPPENKNQPYILIRFRYTDPYGIASDETYIGLVVEKVHCTFDSDLPKGPLEDIYALYASILTKESRLVEETTHLNPAKLSAWRPQWKGEQRTNVVIRSTINLNPQLNLSIYKNRPWHCADKWVSGLDYHQWSTKHLVSKIRTPHSRELYVWCYQT